MHDKEEVEVLINGSQASTKVKIVMAENESEIVKFRLRNLSLTTAVLFTSCDLCYNIDAVILSDKHKISSERGKD